ncbi:hypothetical protein [Clostridium sp. BJN0001]|uniref:hypothetical protein n=1 Tax=Clostridium sp. BJN0001 TaxID=2930219 RepID=UPI001FD50C11|nr:hypothetical protein [Clostridium sp. BJN0001]
MNIKNLKRFTILLIAVFFISFKNVYAENKPNIDLSEPKTYDFKVSYVTDGEKVTLSQDDASLYNIDIDTRVLQSGYYSASFETEINEDISIYKGIALYFKNDSDEEIRINFDIQSTDGKIYKVQDEKIVCIQDNGSFIEREFAENGSFKLSEEFNGIVYVPFDSFSNEESFYSSLSSASIFRLITVTKEESRQKLSIGELSFINSTDNEFIFDSNIKFFGDREVQIPIDGESIAEYKLSDNSGLDRKLNTKYELLDDLSDASITDDGKLTVFPDADEKKIRIIAKIDEMISQEIDVDLVKSWTTKVDGADMIKKESDENQILNIYNSLLFNKYVLYFLRITAICIPILIFRRYYLWKKNK